MVILNNKERGWYTYREMSEEQDAVHNFRTHCKMEMYVPLLKN